MKTWTFDELKSALELLKSESKIFSYTASHSLTDRQEFYLIQDARSRVALDQARRVDSEIFRVQLYTRKANGRLGVSMKPLLPFQPLAEQLASLVESADIGDEELWELNAPKKPDSLPGSNAFPALKENFEKGAQAIQADLSAAIAKATGIFNSAELFVNLEKERRIASNGFDHTSERSRIYTEVCFSSEDSKKNSEEFLITQWYGHPEQLDIGKMCADSSEYAEASLTTERPETGSYAVILHADVLNNLWSGCMHQLDSQEQYFKQPFREPGSEFIPGFCGDGFELSVDPKMPYCFASQDFDRYGEPQKKLLLVSRNKVEASLTGKRFAQYLKKPETTDWGCLVIEPSASRPLAELRKAKPKVLEILQFSGLFANRASLTYSSEIRLARLYDNEKGTVTYIKGGNLSGNMMENFKEVRWSSESCLDNHSDYSGRGLGYSGPAYALVTDVAVSS